MTTQTEALKLAQDLEQYADMVENSELISPDEMNCASIMRLAAEVLAQPEQEPVAMLPPQRKPLTIAQITSVAYDCNALPEVITNQTLIDFVRALEVIYGVKE